MCDVVKVLDFGLVKAVDSDKEASLTAAGSLTGTPLYVSPEAIERPDEVDGRSDLYAVGAVGYFLLTGQPVFDGANVVEICMHHVNSEPEQPSSRGVAVSEDFEAAILACLAKSTADRPQDAKDLLERLRACESDARWTHNDALHWWSEFAGDKARTIVTDNATQTDAHEVTIIANISQDAPS